MATGGSPYTSRVAVGTSKWSSGSLRNSNLSSYISIYLSIYIYIYIYINTYTGWRRVGASPLCVSQWALRSGAMAHFATGNT